MNSPLVTAVLTAENGFSPLGGVSSSIKTGDTVNFTAPTDLVIVTPTFAVRFAGWKLYGKDASGKETLLDWGEQNSGSVTYAEGTDLRLEWQVGEVVSLGKSASPSAYAKKVSFSLDPSYVAEGVTLTNFPLLVRLSTSVSGFDYGDFMLPQGGDMMFTDGDGSLLSHEIDEWNVGGVSYVWVKVPRLTRDTVLTLHYGNGAQPIVNSADTWSEYHAVWHFNEERGPALDSSGNGRIAMPTGFARGNQERVAGRVGYGRKNPADAGFSVGMTGFRHGGTLSLGGWFTAGYNILSFSGRTDFGMGTPYNSTSIRAIVNGKILEGSPGGHSGQYLTHLGYGVHDDVIEIFGMGTKAVGGAGIRKTGTIAAGSMAEGTGNLEFPGVKGTSTVDEWRIKRTATSDAWEKADSHGMQDGKFVLAGEVSDEERGVAVLAPTIEKTADGWKVSATISAGEAQLAVAYECGEAAVTNDLTSGVVSAPQTVVDEPTGLAADKVYRVVVLAKDAGGNILTATPGSGLCTGELNVLRVVDAGENEVGLFSVVLGDGAKAADAPILVKYVASGAAVDGRHCRPLSGEVWLPAGATQATIPVVITGASGRSSELTLTLSAGAYAIGADSSAQMMVNDARDPANLVWTAGNGVWDYAEPENWLPQYAPGEKDTVTLTATGVDTTARMSGTESVADMTLAPSSDGAARLDLNGQLFYIADALMAAGNGVAEIKSGTLSALAFGSETSEMRLADLVLSNRTANGGVSFNCGGQRIALDEFTFCVNNDAQTISAVKLSADDIVLSASNAVLRAINPTDSGVNLNFNLTGKNVRADLVGAQTDIKGGVVFGADSENCVVSLKGGRFNGGWTGAGSDSCVLDGVSNSVRVSESVVQSTLAYARTPGTGCSLTVGKGGSLRLVSVRAMDGVENRVEIEDGSLTSLGFQFGTAATSSGNRLVLRGTNATMTISDNLKIGNNAAETTPVTLAFETGANLWTAAPFNHSEAGGVVAFSNVVFSVDATKALDAMKKNHCKLPLMSFKSANATNVDWSAYNDTLVMPEHQCGNLRLETTLNNKGAFTSATLWCDVKRDIGLMILVK